MSSRDEVRKALVDYDALLQEASSYSTTPEKPITTGLLSPEATPEPDNERSKSELGNRIKSKRSELTALSDTLANAEIERITKCSQNDIDSLLGIDDKAENKERARESEWIFLGPLLKEKKLDNAEKAFKRLELAAKVAGVNPIWIKAVDRWDKNTNLLKRYDAYPDEKKKNEAEATKEIERILTLPNESFDDILGVDNKETDKEQTRIKNWRIKGCLIHPDFWDYAKIEEAYEKLKKAAEAAKVESQFIGEVDNWNGYSDLLDDFDEVESLYEGEDIMDAEVANAPDQVKEIYKNSSTLFKKLIADPSNLNLKEEVEKNNDTIISLTEAYNSQAAVDARVSKDLWTIKTEVMLNHYKSVLDRYKILHESNENELLPEEVPENNDDLNQLEKIPKEIELAKRFIPKLRAGLVKFLDSNHYPSDWNIPDAPYYQKLLSEDPGSDSKADPGSDSKAARKLDETTANWYAIEGENGERLIGARKHGPFGHQVCMEIWENDRWIRRLEAASKCGIPLKSVQEFIDNPLSRNLSEDQDIWSYKDRNNFVKLHWVAMGRIQVKNLSRGNKTCPTYCCAEFKGVDEKKKGIKVLTGTNFYRVLGVSGTRSEIAKYCGDKIVPPWNVKPISEIESPAAAENDAQERRKMEKKLPSVEINSKNLGMEEIFQNGSAGDMLMNMLKTQQEMIMAEVKKLLAQNLEQVMKLIETKEKVGGETSK
ncbi:hypothetical protein V8C42DRAFT_337034 [Trichoderma barbatum]